VGESADGLTAFLNARLDEDEVAANAAAGATEGTDWIPLAPSPDTPYRAFRHHIARHDPARVLREVEARRAILAEAQRAISSIPLGHRHDFIMMMLRQCAAVWSDHPDYLPEWAPGT